MDKEYPSDLTDGQWQKSQAAFAATIQAWAQAARSSSSDQRDFVRESNRLPMEIPAQVLPELEVGVHGVSGDGGRRVSGRNFTIGCARRFECKRERSPHQLLQSSTAKV